MESGGSFFKHSAHDLQLPIAKETANAIEQLGLFKRELDFGFGLFLGFQQHSDKPVDPTGNIGRALGLFQSIIVACPSSFDGTGKAEQYRAPQTLRNGAWER